MDGLCAIVSTPVNGEAARAVLSRFDLAEEVVEALEPGMPRECYLADRERGVRIHILPNGSVGTIFLYPEGRHGFRQYPYPLIGGLTFAATQPDVVRQLGLPSQSAVLRPAVLDVGGWVKYTHDNHVVHFTFSSDDGAVSLVTIMSIDWKPGSHDG